MRVWAIAHPISLPKLISSRLSHIWLCFSVEYFGYLTNQATYQYLMLRVNNYLIGSRLRSFPFQLIS